MICPKLLAVRVRTGFPRLTVFSRLNASRRNSKFLFPVEESKKRLVNEASTVNSPGPLTGFLGEFPNEPVAGRTKAAVLNHFAIFSSRDRSPERFGSAPGT